MKILHVIGSDKDGGAAKGAINLHKLLLSRNIDSYVYFGYCNTKSNFPFLNIIIDYKNSNFFFYRLRIKIDQFLSKIFGKKNKIIFSSGLFGLDFKRVIKNYKIDIIHLHWINNSTISIKQISSLTVPIVFTMRDYWLFTGGCHHPIDCNRYKIGCGKCKYLNSDKVNDFSKFIYKQKLKYFGSNFNNISLVSISNYLKEKAKDSYLLKNKEITSIPNLVDFSNLNDFFDERNNKYNFPISTKKKILIQNHTNEIWKGTSINKNLIKILFKEYDLFSFGIGQSYENVHNFGIINDQSKLSQIYSYCDLFIFLSQGEPFGKVLFEAAWCGSKVISFNNHGTSEFYKNQKWWYLIDTANVEEIYKKIKSLINAPVTKISDMQNDLLKIINSDSIYNSYMNVYKKALKN